MAHVSPPKIPSAFPHLQRTRRKTPFAGGLRKRWTDDRGNIYEWDYLHGTLEMYDKRGKHLGEFDPITGEQLKPAQADYNVRP